MGNCAIRQQDVEDEAVTDVSNSLLQANSEDRIASRGKILEAESFIDRLVKGGELQDAEPLCPITHSFSPISDEYGCCTYARQIFIPKGTVAFGKIHRHSHHNFLMQGCLSVVTEHGKEYLRAPHVFVSEPGTKKAVYAEEDTILVTVHMTRFRGEDELEKIEKELVSPSYADLGFIVSDKVEGLK
jgi:hypothetical protein